MYLVHHNFKAACLLSFYLSLSRMAPCKFVLLRSYGVFAHDVLILYPLQFTGSPFFTLAAFIIQRSLSSFDRNSSFLRVPNLPIRTNHCLCIRRKTRIFLLLTTASVNLLFANGHLTLSSSFFSLKSHYFSSSFSTFQRKSREFSSILSLFSPFDKGHSGVWLESRPRGPKSLTTLPRDRLIFPFDFLTPLGNPEIGVQVDS